jgi:putative transposase
MARLARVVLPGAPHHITQRGNRQLNVFHEEADYQRYLALLLRYSEKFGLALAGYCLMTNHVHLVGVPQREDSIARTLKDCHGVYAAEFNKKYSKTGHLWQCRPYSCPLDYAHAWAALRYVERNPVRAGMISRAENYAWSSAPAHCGSKTDPLLTSDWFQTGSVPDWSSWLAADGSSQQEQQIRDRTFTGRPCGDDEFTREIETALQRSLQPAKPGPKPQPRADHEERLPSKG